MVYMFQTTSYKLLSTVLFKHSFIRTHGQPPLTIRINHKSGQEVRKISLLTVYDKSWRKLLLFHRLETQQISVGREDWRQVPPPLVRQSENETMPLPLVHTRGRNPGLWMCHFFQLIVSSVAYRYCDISSISYRCRIEIEKVISKHH